MRLRDYHWRLCAVVLECGPDGHLSRLFQGIRTAQRTRTSPDAPASARGWRGAGETGSHRTQRLDWFRFVRAAGGDDWRRLSRWRPFGRGGGRAAVLRGCRQSSARDSAARSWLISLFEFASAPDAITSSTPFDRVAEK